MTPSSPWYTSSEKRSNPPRLLAANDAALRHGSVQVVSSTNGDVAIDDPNTGLSNTLIAAHTDVEVVSDTKYVHLHSCISPFIFFSFLFLSFPSS